MQNSWQAKEAPPRRKARRGPPGQIDRRVAERAVRFAAVAFARWTSLGGVERVKVAQAMGISERTLLQWERDWREDRLPTSPRGRPAERSDRETRNLVIALLNLMGPNTGVPILQALFPEMPRREVEDLVGRYKRLHAKKSEMELHTLRWLRPGAVWAMDFQKPTCPVDGAYPIVMAVRDLASQKQLDWGGLPDKTEQSVIDILTALFVKHGPPLILKSDQEGPFKSEATRQVLDAWGVIPLLSPFRTPEYNGSCEAGIGSMKRRTHIEAARNNHPGYWTADDLEAARLQANETGRPWGPTKPTPQEVWSGREPIPAKDRQHFAEDVQFYRDKVRKEYGYLLDAVIDKPTTARIERKAIGRALVARGFLQIRRRRVSLPLKRLFSANIS
jgi:transposase InsO family protein